MAPVAHEILRAQIQSHIDSNKVMIFSKSTCPYCKKVKSFFESNGEAFFALELDLIEEGDALHEVLIEMTNHKTVPNVFVNGTHIGGCDDTIKAYEEGRVQKLLTAHTYDYDLVVIGGGSGGLACAKEAAGLGKKVAVLDFVQPTPIGTTWGLGGTCVNVGCIPKKLMHQASLLGEAVKESAHYGWKPSENMVHSWETMKENVQNHIGSLNWNYRVQLREKSVNYLNMLGQFVGDHKIKVTKKNGSSEEVTAERFVVAVGGRPNYPNIPGAKEFGITSDDVFSLPYCPGKTVVVGASYVALECAGFLAGLGMDVTVMVRSILLRGFDQDMAARIGAYMESHGIKFIREAVPTKVEKVKEGNPGTLRVNYRYVDGTEAVEECSTILFAIGRTAITEPLNLGSVGVKVSPENQKILTKQEQSSVPYIYAIGDCIQEATMPGKGMLELTPVAIKAGQLLARRLYDKSSVFMDYNNIPTTVFTPLEYGAIGYSEDAALEEFGDDIEVYHSYFWPLEWTVSHREENACYAKLICLKSDRERVIGLHVLSPNAGEITQGYAVGMRLGATKNDFSMTVGIHPTNSEVFTTLSVSKSSGSSVEAGGC